MPTKEQIDNAVVSIKDRISTDYVVLRGTETLPGLSQPLGWSLIDPPDGYSLCLKPQTRCVWASMSIGKDSMMPRNGASYNASLMETARNSGWTVLRPKTRRCHP